MTWRDTGRLLRTVRHLRPAQIVHRVRLRMQKQLYSVAPGVASRHFASAGVTSARQWPSGFVPTGLVMHRGAASPTVADRGVFELLNVRADLGWPVEWMPSHHDQLWRYHLHYFDWAWGWVEAATDEQVSLFGDLFRSWRDSNPVGRWDAWSPYVVSLRAWTICALLPRLSKDAELVEEVSDQLAIHARYLRLNLEWDVGGNHVVKNLKALIGLGVALGDDAVLRRAVTHLDKQLDVQILADGGHFERSTGYHAQVLADLVDVHGLLLSAEVEPAFVERLHLALHRMRGWLATTASADRVVPCLNDSIPVGPELLDLLAVPRVDAELLAVLPDSGYAVLTPRPDVTVIMDIGPPCPPDLPAHAQADALALVARVDGVDVLVDAGTSVYGSGPRRQYERSTRAHSTIEVDGFDQTEVWGAFRAGRRHAVTVTRAESIGRVALVEASHNGYRSLPGRPVHTRRVSTAPGVIVIDDLVQGGGTHDMASHWHLGEGATWSASERSATIGGVILSFGQAVGAEFEFVPGGAIPLGLAAQDHNVLVASPCVVVRWSKVELPVEHQVRIHHG
jgi:hypothetical protein